MLKIYIARHGQDEDNLAGILNGHRDTQLTSTGIQQAKNLSQAIKNASLTFDAVYASPLKRAYRTAEIVTDALSIAKPIKTSDLIERDFGVMTGKPVADIEKLCAPDILKTQQIVYFLAPKDAETFPQLIERGKRVLAMIRSKHKDGNILCVTHGDMGKMIYAAYYGMSWKDALTLFHFGNSDLLLLSPDSGSEETHMFAFEQSR